jgi:hypothetical protein
VLVSLGRNCPCCNRYGYAKDARAQLVVKVESGSDGNECRQASSTQDACSVTKTCV